MTGALATKHAAIKDSGHGKSPEAFRTISEVASELDVPQHVLRFWESRFAQVRPVKRAGGRRYYRPEDVDLLRGIRALLYHDGLTIKGVQKVLRDQGLKYVAEIGRGEATLMGSVERERALPVDDEPRFARAAFKVLERAIPPVGEIEDAEEVDAAGEAGDQPTPDPTESEIEDSAEQGETAPVSVSANEAPGLFDDQHHVNGQATNGAEAPNLDAAQRSKLELLLSDLLVLKSRLRAAQERAAN